MRRGMRREFRFVLRQERERERERVGSVLSPKNGWV